MKTRKKTWIFLLAALSAVFLALAACGDKTPKPSGGGVPDEEDYTPSRSVSETKVVTYDGPELMTTSDKVAVKVAGRELFVYETRVNHARLHSWGTPSSTAPVALFDFEGRVPVEIDVKAGGVQNAVVRPLSYGIQPEVKDGKITFFLDYPANYTVEYNGDPKTAVHLFANPIETEEPDPNNLPENMVYIGPGVYRAGAIPVKSGTTVYIAGGAVVFGQIRAEGVENLTIRGRGIIDGSIFPRTKESEYTLPIEIRSSKNVVISDLAFLDPAGWAITLYRCEDVTVDNVKIITARSNGDGISVQSCKNVDVRGGFVRTWDDSLVVKNVDRGDTSGVTFNGTVVWTDLAQSMEIGYETNGALLEDITFKNITVLHNFHKPAMSIHNSDDALVKNVLYQNITIEDAQMRGDNPTPEDDFLIDMRIAYDPNWTESGGTRGKIQDVTFSNIVVLQCLDSITSRLVGADKDHGISNVSVYDMTIAGKAVTSAQDMSLSVNEYAEAPAVSHNADAAVGAKRKLPYRLELAGGDTPEVAVKANISQEGMIVPEFAHLKAEPPYMGVKCEGDFSIRATHGVGATSTAKDDDGSGDWEKAGFPASNLLDGERGTGWVNRVWSGEKDEFVALTVTFDAPKQIGMVRIFGQQDSGNYYAYRVSVYAIEQGSTASRPLRVLAPQEYELSPASGGYLDIKVPTREYTVLQLRIFAASGITAQRTPALNEMEFYPASLTFGKSVETSEHEDVYDSTNITDGLNNTYFESKKGVWPAHVTVDMEETYLIKYINIHLPQLMTWEPRTQEIQILVSTDGKTFTEIVPKKAYLFDPALGNMAAIVLDTPAEARYIKLVYTSNSNPGGYGAQISELYVFGV